MIAHGMLHDSSSLWLLQPLPLARLLGSRLLQGQGLALGPARPQRTGQGLHLLRRRARSMDVCV